MTRSVALTILRCLDVSGDARSAMGGLRQLSVGEWQGAIPWLDSSGLALYFRERIAQAYALPLLPPFVRAHIERAGRDHHRRAREVFDEFRSLNRLFENPCVPYAVLKGFSLAPEYCPDPKLRVQYDHDFLIHPSAVDGLDKALRAAGYRRKPSRETYAALYLPLSMRMPTGRLNPYSSELARPVEIHWSLWDGKDDGIDLAFPDGVFERIRWHEYGGVRFPALSDEDALLFQVLHAFRHILHSWCRLSVFLELAHFLAARSCNGAFWQRYGARLGADRRLAEISSMVFTLAGRLFGAPVPAQFGLRADSQPGAVLAAWVERYGVKSVLANFRDDKFPLFLHREFVSDAREWRRIWRRRLFPLQRPNRLPHTSATSLAGQVAGRLRQLRHSLQRVFHHLARAVRYGIELPAWRRVRNEAVFSFQCSAGAAAESAAPERAQVGWKPPSPESL